MADQTPYGPMLKKIIKSIKDSYQKGELAYLALTSKVENPLRDKIAFEFHKKMGSDKVICREWTNHKTNRSKADIAILDSQGNPECIIECKAHSSVSGIGQWVTSLINDINKNRALYDDVQIIFVLFANVVTPSSNEEGLNKYGIKYYENIVKAMNRSYTPNKQKEDWEKSLAKKGVTCKLDNYLIDAGAYQGLKVQVNTFIHEEIVY